MNKDTTLTLSDLEALARAYLDCGLSRLEERELALVLATSDADSPLLAEARESMGLELEMARAEELRRNQAARKALRRRRVFRWSGVAVCALLLAGTGWTLLHPNQAKSPEVEVFVDGRQIYGSMARAEASRMQAEDMEMMREFMTEAKRQQNENMEILNELI